MTIFKEIRYNSLGDYRTYCPWDEFSKTDNIDKLDKRMLREGHRLFGRFLEEKNTDHIFKIWGRAFARLDLTHELFKKRVDWEKPQAGDWPYKRQAMRVYLKCFIYLLSIESLPGANLPELDAVIRICLVSRIFFNGPTHHLDFLFSKMFPVEDLHPHQWAAHPDFPNQWMPHPPKSCWKNPLRWAHDDWHEDHLTGWDCVYSIMRGLVLDSDYFVCKTKGLIAIPKSFLEKTWEERRVHGLFFEMLSDMRRRQKGSHLCINFTLSELDQKEGFWIDKWPSLITQRAAIDTSIARVRVNLIRTGLPPSMIIDISECVTEKQTQWTKEDHQSENFLPIFHLFSEFGTREELEEFLKIDPKWIERYYESAKDLSDTPYQRATRNSCPDVLIPFLEEVAKDPHGRLAEEMSGYDLDPETELPIWSYFHFWPNYESWRRRPQNHLILACQLGSLQLANYLIEKKEKEAASCLDVEEIDQIINTEGIVSEFVNRLGCSGAPAGTPLDIAMKNEHDELAEFLESKGARVSPNLEEHMTGNLSDRMKDILERSRIEQEALRLKIREQGFNITITSKLIGQLSRIQARSNECLEGLKGLEHKNEDLEKGLKGSVVLANKQKEMLKSLNEHLELFEQAQLQVLTREAERQERNCREASREVGDYVC